MQCDLAGNLTEPETLLTDPRPPFIGLSADSIKLAANFSNQLILTSCHKYLRFCDLCKELDRPASVSSTPREFGYEQWLRGLLLRSPIVIVCPKNRRFPKRTNPKLKDFRHDKFLSIEPEIATVPGPIVPASLMPTGPSYLYLKHDQVVTGYPRLNPVVRTFGRSKSRPTLITFSSVVATCDFFMVDAEGQWRVDLIKRYWQIRGFRLIGASRC